MDIEQIKTLLDMRMAKYPDHACLMQELTFKDEKIAALEAENARLSRIVRAAELVADKYEIYHQKRFSYCPMEEFERAEDEYTDSVIRLGEIVSGMPVEGGAEG